MASAASRSTSPLKTAPELLSKENQSVHSLHQFIPATTHFPGPWVVPTTVALISPQCSCIYILFATGWASRCARSVQFGLQAFSPNHVCRKHSSSYFFDTVPDSIFFGFYFADSRTLFYSVPRAIMVVSDGPHQVTTAPVSSSFPSTPRFLWLPIP